MSNIIDFPNFHEREEKILLREKDIQRREFELDLFQLRLVEKNRKVESMRSSIRFTYILLFTLGFMSSLLLGLLFI